MRLESEKVVHKSEFGCNLACGEGGSTCHEKSFEQADPALLNIKFSVNSVSARTGLFLMHYCNM